MTITDLFQKRVFDDDKARAKSLRELATEFGVSLGRMNVMMREKLKSGEAEQVWRHAKPRAVPVYRLKKK